VQIRLDKIDKRFGDTVVADGLTLDITDGEFFTFLGPSGCGKSTLLNLIAGIEAPDSGRILLGARDVTALPPQKRDVAMVFQSYALYPHLSVFENLAFPLRNRGAARDAIQAEVRRVAEILGLTGLLAHRPHQLSGGQRQRVALGRALIRRPAAFLMDEPLSNLDAALRLELREEIKRVHRSHNITTVYVTHDQEEAMVLSDRVAVLRAGRVQQCDAPAGIYSRPANMHVAQSVGAPPMNLLPAASLAGHPAVRARLAARAPDALVIGVRPEDVEVHARPAPSALPAEIVLVEATGAQTWTTGRMGDIKLRGRLAPDTRLAAGATGYFDFSAGALHLFDAASGARVDAPAARGAQQ
jgi:ABC-type sugar transport system ATPase subunit